MTRRMKLGVVLVTALGLAACTGPQKQEATPAAGAGEGASTSSEAPAEGSGLAAAPADSPGHAAVAIPAAEADSAVVAALRLAYPMTTCPISGKELGSMGEPYEILWEGRLVRFCCSHCLPTFEKDPAATLAKIDAARATGSGEEAGSSGSAEAPGKAG